MASKTTYTCDRCGEESNATGFLKHLRVVISDAPGFNPGGRWGDDSSRGAEWCSDCLHDTGLWVRRPVMGEAPENAPLKLTLEGLIRDIVRHEVDDLHDTLE